MAMAACACVRPAGAVRLAWLLVKPETHSRPKLPHRLVSFMRRALRDETWSVISDF